MRPHHDYRKRGRRSPMRSMPQLVENGRKDRRLGEPSGQSWEQIEALELNARVELVRALLPLGLAEVGRMLDEEVEGLELTRRSQAVDAKTSQKTSFGVRHPKVRRGRRLSSKATERISRSENVVRSFDRGKYCRRRPFRFSIVGRCQGLRGSQKKTGKPVSLVTPACSAISFP